MPGQRLTRREEVRGVERNTVTWVILAVLAIVLVFVLWRFVF
jgi:hypothetical protein